MSSIPYNNPPAALTARLRSIFNTQTCSDIDVVCANNDRYMCHKLVLSQSEVLAKAFDPQLNFKESVQGVIELPNDEPSAVKAMLEYLYTCDYAYPDDASDSHTLVFHVSIYALGEIYAISGLKQLATERFRKAAKRSLEGHVIAPAIQAIYESTPEHDRGLRDVALTLYKPRIKELLADNEFKEMMNNVGAFGTDLVLNLNINDVYITGLVQLPYWCRRCANETEMNLLFKDVRTPFSDDPSRITSIEMDLPPSNTHSGLTGNFTWGLHGPVMGRE